MPGCGGSQRRACCITPAAICTDGPSRPLANPPISEPAVSSALATLMRSETSVARAGAGRLESSVAITCGMPEPEAPGTNRRVSHSTPAVHAGVHTSGASGCSARTVPKATCARSQSRKNATTDSPAAAALASTIRRASHWRQSARSPRMAATTSGCGEWGGSGGIIAARANICANVPVRRRDGTGR